LPFTFIAQPKQLSQTLQRKIGLLQATAINMIDMVGIGPFITLPIVINLMNGPGFLWAWVLGAVLSLVDATIWCELGTRFPLAGGTYNFLRESYGKNWGKLMSFLFVWQTMIQAPLVIASASIGFAGYLKFLVPTLTSLQGKAVSGSIVLLIIFLLYRKIEGIGKISVIMWGIVLTTLALIISGGIWYGNFLQPIREMNDGFSLDKTFMIALGYASVKTVYSYLGYYNVAIIGGEIVNPSKNIPRSMFISIIGIAILYLCMNISVTSVVPWQQAMHNEFVVSTFVEILAGHKAAIFITGLILCVAFSSVFSATLGYSRIPYAAAVDGAFFKVFAKLHPTKNFPHISLLFIGSVAFVFSLLFKLEDVIKAILAMRILVQFIGQAVGLVFLRRNKNLSAAPYKMPFYPLPIIIAIIMWTVLFIATNKAMILGLIALAAGLIVYLVKANVEKAWPFAKNDQ
jgi:fructoselysine transporter